MDASASVLFIFFRTQVTRINAIFVMRKNPGWVNSKKHSRKGGKQMDILVNIAMLLIGAAFGVIVTLFVKDSKKPDGVIFINRGDEDYAACGVRFYVGADNIATKKRVILNVNSHK